MTGFCRFRHVIGDNRQTKTFVMFSEHHPYNDELPEKHP